MSINDDVVFTEIKANLMSEDDKQKQSYSMFVKWKENIPVDFKIVNSEGESIEREIEEDEETLFNIDVFKKMAKTVSKPDKIK